MSSYLDIAVFADDINNNGILRAMRETPLTLTRVLYEHETERLEYTPVLLKLDPQHKIYQESNKIIMDVLASPRAYGWS